MENQFPGLFCPVVKLKYLRVNAKFNEWQGLLTDNLRNNL